jgi:metallo-beta-lactamase family protein
MATGGRVLHTKAFAPDPRNTILFVVFKFRGRGAAIVDGAESVKIHGEYVPIKAEIVVEQPLRARRCVGDHGVAHTYPSCAPADVRHAREPAAADALRHRLRSI